MSNGKSGRKKLAKAVSIVILVILWCLVTTLFPEDDAVGTTSNTQQQQYENTATEQSETTESTETNDNQETQNTNGTATEEVLIFTMVDVGQADGFVLEYEDKVAVIDCGAEDTCEALVNYLNQREIAKIDFLFGSHPHDDHMGGMLTILENFEIGKIIIPEVEGIGSDWYEELEDEFEAGDYNLEYLKEDDVYYLGDVTITVLEQFEPPLDEINNYSAIMKVTLGEIDILMTGDAETAVEKELLQSGKDISAEILKVGHHGSKTSTSNKFLDAVNPEYALISCAVRNKHKHPTETTMEKLESREIIVYRTDECGTVVLTITPTDVTFNCEPGDYLSGTELKEKVRDELWKVTHILNALRME